MRVLVDPGSHHLLNAGDVAMLQVCVERVRAARPDARLRVLTTAPALLQRYCPGVEALAAEGRYALLERMPAMTVDARARSGGSGLRRAIGKRRGRERLRRAADRIAAEGAPQARAFADALLTADLLLMSGRGGLTDAFAGEARAVLDELAIAARIGLPAALMGQGVGPLESRELRARAREVLPTVALVSLREGRAGPALLADAGVGPDRIVVTGDDVVEPALRARGQAAAGSDAVGLSLRVADYAGVSERAAAEVGAAAAALAERRGAEVAPIAISTHPAERDADAVRSSLHVGADGESLSTARAVTALAESPGRDAVAAAIEATGRCRVVVAGSYHAAVFALAQGVPALGVAASDYYADKLHGLREQFGAGCAIVDLREPGASDRVTSELESLWDRAPALRTELLAAAERQVESGRAAYERLAALVG